MSNICMWCGNHLTTRHANLVCTNVLCYMRDVKQLSLNDGGQIETTSK